MAEEKYIFAFDVDNKDDLKDNLPECNGCVCFPCDETCIGRKKAISRQEAIERMAKALIRADYPHAQEVIWDMRWKEEASKDYYLIMAEAALNALLEGK